MPLAVSSCVDQIDRLLIIPGHPRGGMGHDAFEVLLQFGEVVKGIDVIQFAGVNQTHEHVADLGTVGGFVEVGVFTVEDDFFQGTLAEVVVQGHAGVTQEEG